MCAEKRRFYPSSSIFLYRSKSCQVRMRNNERKRVINDRSFVCWVAYWRRHPVITQHALFLYYKGKTKDKLSNFFVAIPFRNIQYSQLCFSPNNNIINKTYCYIFIGGSDKASDAIVFICHAIYTKRHWLAMSSICSITNIIVSCVQCVLCCPLTERIYPTASVDRLYTVNIMFNAGIYRIRSFSFLFHLLLRWGSL